MTKQSLAPRTNGHYQPDVYDIMAENDVIKYN